MTTFQRRQITNLRLQRKIKESITEQDTGKLVFAQAPLSLPPSTSLYALLGSQVILIRWFQGILVLVGPQPYIKPRRGTRLIRVSLMVFLYLVRRVHIAAGVVEPIVRVETYPVGHVLKLATVDSTGEDLIYLPFREPIHLDGVFG